MTLLLLLALFMVSLLLLLLGRFSERLLGLLTALLVLGLCFLVLSVNVQVGGAVVGVPPRMQGLLTVVAALLGGSLVSLLWRPAPAQEDKLAKFRRPASDPGSQAQKGRAQGNRIWRAAETLKLPQFSPLSPKGRTTRTTRTSTRNTRTAGGSLRTAKTARNRLPQRVGH